MSKKLFEMRKYMNTVDELLESSIMAAEEEVSENHNSIDFGSSLQVVKVLDGYGKEFYRVSLLGELPTDETVMRLKELDKELVVDVEAEPEVAEVLNRLDIDFYNHSF